ncbi:MAG: PadR family transcriptional regulator, regulatory protein PadR [Sphingomonadales bacterium]|jgi:DNA-binding PadR family transcriptional regulator|nr:PadR family transcriptional regulator, regulatory protein PadR [Sphingomonadales bacterium]
MSRDTLGSFELLVLGTLAHLPSGAHGTALMARIEQRHDREVSVGALYTTLDRLEKKGFARSEWGEPTPQRGGRRKRIFTVTAAGATALGRTQVLLQTLTSPPVAAREGC